jgi:gluconokinase
MSNPTRFIIVMGVSGCGKTTIGRMLAKRLDWDFYDADNFHPIENITKMANGIPLADSDREPWLDSLRRLITTCLEENRPGVLACSALKQKYRAQLIKDDLDIQVVYLRGSFELIWSRMSERPDHYMKPNMLRSQFETLEEPSAAVVADIGPPPGEMCDEILSRIQTAK